MKSDQQRQCAEVRYICSITLTSLSGDVAEKESFQNVMNYLLSHENDTYNLNSNNCTSMALNAFNLTITPDLLIEPFTVQIPGLVIPLVFEQSPQKLYKRIGTFNPTNQITKEFDVSRTPPTSHPLCP